MVDPSMPWSLKGISDEAREFAKFSADEAHIPVGAWLSAVIRTAAAQEAGTDPQTTVAGDENSRPSSSVQSVSRAAPQGTMGSTIERAAQFVDDFGFEPEGPARDTDLINDPVVLQEELLALESRFESSKANTQANLGPLIEEIERIRRRLDDLKTR